MKKLDNNTIEYILWNNVSCLSGLCPTQFQGRPNQCKLLIRQLHFCCKKFEETDFFEWTYKRDMYLLAANQLAFLEHKIKLYWHFTACLII